MVNDQLIRIHQLRLLALEKASPKGEEGDDKAASPTKSPESPSNLGPTNSGGEQEGKHMVAPDPDSPPPESESLANTPTNLDDAEATMRLGLVSSHENKEYDLESGNGPQADEQAPNSSPEAEARLQEVLVASSPKTGNTENNSPDSPTKDDKDGKDKEKEKASKRPKSRKNSLSETTNRKSSSKSPKSSNKTTKTSTPLKETPPRNSSGSSGASLRKQSGRSSDGSNSSGGNNTSTGSGSGGKRRSAWRNLLTPNYKSRSDEFHKLFCDKIPKTERLIADYSCALHREILIQGRIYIGINYIAFYSNLFSWITKLVVRLRDVAEIYKANTARIIPNAVQIITTSGEKHTFASFVARDKSYVMLLRMWQNNLMNERMTDQEIRNLVHISYGKDLGMSDNEELKINSPDPVTPANVDPPPKTPPNSPTKHVGNVGEDESIIDRNNNTSTNSSEIQTSEINLSIGTEAELDDRADSDSEAQKPLLLSSGGESDNRKKKVNNLTKECSQKTSDSLQSQSPAAKRLYKKAHSRYNSLDYKNGLRIEERDESMIEQVASRLDDLIRCEAGGEDSINSSNGLAGSTVLLETPKSLEEISVNRRGSRQSESFELEDDERDGDFASNEMEHHEDDRESTSKRQRSSPGRRRQQQQLASATTNRVEDLSNMANEEMGEDDVEMNSSELYDSFPIEIGSAGGGRRNSSGAAGPPIELTTHCDCVEHLGQLIADRTFDINVDTLFTLIFTNSKFMRDHMIRHGRLGTVMSNWTRSSGSHKSLVGVGAGSGCGDISPSGGGGDGGKRESINIESGANNTTQLAAEAPFAGISADGEDANWHQLCEQTESAAFNKWIEGSYINQQPHLVKIQQARQLNYYMNLDHFLAKQVQIEEKQSICRVESGVYVLKSVTINSGIPYGETFTVDLTYCLTRAGSLNRSRMLVHGLVNFKPEKLTWKVGMVRPMIEKSSLQGVGEFIDNLTDAVRDYVVTKSKLSKSKSVLPGASGPGGSSPAAAMAVPRGTSGASFREDISDLTVEGAPPRISLTPSSDPEDSNSSAATVIPPPRHHKQQQHLGSRSESSLTASSKSTLKAQRIRSMYKYYIGNRDDIESANATSNSIPNSYTGNELDFHEDLALTSGSGRQSAPVGEFLSAGRRDRRQVNSNNLDEDEMAALCEHCGDVCCSCSCGDSLVSIGELATDSGSMVMMASEVEVDSLSIGFNMGGGGGGGTGILSAAVAAEEREADGSRTPTSGGEHRLYQGYEDEHGEDPTANPQDNTSIYSRPNSRQEWHRRAIRMPSPMRRYLPSLQSNPPASGGGGGGGNRNQSRAGAASPNSSAASQQQQYSPQRENFPTWVTRDGRRVRNAACQTSRRDSVGWLDSPASYGFCICWFGFIIVVFAILFMYVYLLAFYLRDLLSNLNDRRLDGQIPKATSWPKQLTPEQHTTTHQ